MRTDHLRQNSNVQYYPSGTNKHPTTIIFNIDNISSQITDNNSSVFNFSISTQL